MATTVRKAEPKATATTKISGREMYHFSVDQYHAMGEAGILHPDDRVELLEGRIVMMSPINPPHRFALERARRLLDRMLPPGWHVLSQDPLMLEASEPEPDVFVVRGSDEDYQRRHPGAEDVPLVIEVADSSLHDDRHYKGPLYARYGIPCYWIINLIDRQIEVYSQPKRESAAGQAEYLRRETYDAAASVPVVLEGQPIGEILVQELLPESEADERSRG